MSPDAESTIIVPLDAGGMQRYLQELLHIEQLVHLQAGSTYSTEIWKSSHFSLDMNGKFQTSCGLVSGGRMIAFAICSVPHPHIQHIHRIAVHPDFWQKGFSRKLLAGVMEQWKQDASLTRMTAMVNLENNASYSLFRSMGFQLLLGTALKEYLALRKQERFDIRSSYFEDEQGRRYGMFCRTKS